MNSRYETVCASELRARQQAASSRQWTYVCDHSFCRPDLFHAALRRAVSLDDLSPLLSIFFLPRVS
jgi:hypothetical protein